MDLVIYGAQGIALSVYKAIGSSCPGRDVRCFLVSERGNNASSLAGVPVIETETFTRGLSGEQKNNVEVLIATPENAMPDVEKMLGLHGLHHFVRIDSQRLAELMSYYYSSGREYLPLSALPVGCRRADAEVYMAKSYKDKPLNGRYNLPSWLIPIQVGAALCGERLADILDCSGEEISEKNGNYCELTGLYWLWRNKLCMETESNSYGYYGLFQYRRLLALDDDDMMRLINNGVDAVLPYPMAYEPNIEAHHKKYLRDEDWRAMLTALGELHPEYAKEFPRILRGEYMYNYNIVLARREVLLEYCNWLFPVLERTESLSIPRGNERSDRYIGYMGESLCTLYFMYNHKNLNIKHAGCRFLV